MKLISTKEIYFNYAFKVFDIENAFLLDSFWFNSNMERLLRGGFRLSLKGLLDVEEKRKWGRIKAI